MRCDLRAAQELQRHPDPRVYLDAEIPLCGLGPSLTVNERSKLAEAGLAYGECHIVVRAAVHTPRFGNVYAPTNTAERHAPTKLLLG